VFPDPIEDLARTVVETARKRSLRIATAESCTGGLVAGALTGVAGSSEVFDYGFVTYADAAKMKLLGVPETTIATCGAVSEETALSMAVGAMRAAKADLAVAITGIAGPGGGSADKPVGLVWFATATGDGVEVREERFGDIGREAVRLAAVRTALAMLAEAIP
jgi:nicotinamide-nucleotide amidase